MLTAAASVHGETSLIILQNAQLSGHHTEQLLCAEIVKGRGQCCKSSHQHFPEFIKCDAYFTKKIEKCFLGEHIRITCSETNPPTVQIIIQYWGVPLYWRKVNPEQNIVDSPH